MVFPIVEESIISLEKFESATWKSDLTSHTLLHSEWKRNILAEMIRCFLSLFHQIIPPIDLVDEVGSNSTHAKGISKKR